MFFRSHTSESFSRPLHRRAPWWIVVALFATLVGCDYAGYPYYLTVDDLKPLVITVVDQSGSMDAYQSSIVSLVEGSRGHFLSRIYDGDAEAMERLYFVVGWNSGEGWPEAFSAPPSTVMPTSAAGLLSADESVTGMSDAEYRDLLHELDEYPARVYLFYGNGGAAQYADESLDAFIADEYPALLVSRSLLIAVPGSTDVYIDSAEAIIDATDGPRMARYGWSFTQYDPGAVGPEEFVDDVVSRIQRD